jgi:ferredoxin
VNGKFALLINPLGLRAVVDEGQTLLDAAMAAGFTLPKMCRNGACRACIARVERGTVHHCIDWPGISADELIEGWVLPCVAHADTDVVLWQPLAGIAKA